MAAPETKLSDATTGSTAELEAGRLLRGARSLDGLSPAELAQAFQVVEERTRARPRGLPRLRLALAAAALMVGSLAVAQMGRRLASGKGLTGAARPPELHRPALVSKPEQASERTRDPGESPLREAPTLTPSPPAPVPPEVRPARSPAPRGMRRASLERSAPPASESELALESALLERALRQLHGERHPAAALESLEEHDRRFPSGPLMPEAQLARVDALMALERLAEARGEIERALGVLPRGSERAKELLLVKAELLVRDRQWAPALELFEALVSEPGGRKERAMFGRATCLAHLGQTEAGRKALQDYLRQFPSGRYAEKARAALGPESP